jgi:hypothetical protein
MKKFILLALGIFTFSVNYAQTNRDAIQGALEGISKNKKLEYSILTESTNIGRGGSTICDSLLVGSIPNNGYDGVMFDLHVLNFVTLETFSISLDAGNPWVGIFYRTGSYIGNNTSSAGWIMLDSAQVAVPTEGIVKIPVDVNLPLLADSNYAFYVTVIDNVTDCNYKDGTAVGNIAASDINIQIKEGAGGQYPFNVTNSPRILVGSAYYCQVATGINENDLAANIIIQPNPTQHFINISGNFKIDQIEISDISGRLIFNANNERNIDCSEFANGVYFLKIISGNQQVTRKFIKD